MSGWQRLPTELKLEVLSHYLHFSSDSVPVQKRLHDLAIPYMLSTKNHEFVTLSLEAYYKTNTFAMHIAELKTSNMISHPPAAYGHFIQHLEITVENCGIGRTLEDLLLTPRLGWRYLLTPTRWLNPHMNTFPQKITSYTGIDTEWQSYFPNLKHLKITVLVRDMMQEPWEIRCAGCDLPEQGVRKLGEFLEDTEMGITATRVEVEVKAMLVMPKGTEFKAVECKWGCLGRLKGQIEEMALRKK